MEEKTRLAIKLFNSSIQEDDSFDVLFEHMPNIIFFVKDREKRLITGNRALLKMLNESSLDNVCGRRGDEFFPKNIADSFHLDDEYVMQNNCPLIERVELLLNDSFQVVWHHTTKVPLMGKDGKVAGLKGYTRLLMQADVEMHPYQRLSNVVDYINDHLEHKIEVHDLSKICSLSDSQFRRQFKALFRFSPIKFILKLRLQKACTLLKNTKFNIAQVSGKCGFDDQNYFARVFKKEIGCSPLEFRKRV